MLKDFVKIETFLTVARERSFSRASNKAWNISTSSNTADKIYRKLSRSKNYR